MDLLILASATNQLVPYIRRLMTGNYIDGLHLGLKKGHTDSIALHCGNL